MKGTGPVALDCRNPHGNGHRQGLHHVGCWRPATPEERLAGLKPEDGNTAALSLAVWQAFELTLDDRQLADDLARHFAAAWLGVSDE